MPDLNFFHAARGGVSDVVDDAADAELGADGAWSGGPAAAKLSVKPADAILDQAVATLSKLIKVPRRRVGGAVGWRRTCATGRGGGLVAAGRTAYAAVGAARAYGRLAKPVEGTLFFAGEAARTGDVRGRWRGRLPPGAALPGKFCGRSDQAPARNLVTALRRSTVRLAT